MVKCDLEGQPEPDMEPRRLWTCVEKPANDYYSFTHFAHKCNSSAGIRTPLLSDSRWVRWCAGLAELVLRSQDAVAFVCT